MKTRVLIRALVLAAVALLPVGVFAAMPQPGMAGRWKGTAEIVVNWSIQRTLEVELVIAPDGTVAGKIGDAKLVEGVLRRNRGAFGRLLNLETAWIVEGALTGDVIAAERIRRERVKLPLHWRAGGFEGGLHTSGAKVGGKADMILSATRLRLEKQSEAP